MKIPTSSSILLATLAISPSSSCLAAPTGDAPQDTGLSNSSRNSHTSSFYGASAAPSHSDLDKRDDGSCGTVCTLMNSLSGILKVLDVQNADSTQSIDPQDMEALQAAAQEVSRMFNQSSIPAPVQGAAGTVGGVAGDVAGAVGGVAGGVSGNAPGGVPKGPASTAQNAPPKALSNGDAPNAGPGSSAPTQAPPTAGGASPAAAAAPTATPSPSIPQNPPNTPQPSVSPPSLPV